jgi:hypothetical protein
MSKLATDIHGRVAYELSLIFEGDAKKDTELAWRRILFDLKETTSPEAASILLTTLCSKVANLDIESFDTTTYGVALAAISRECRKMSSLSLTEKTLSNQMLINNALADRISVLENKIKITDNGIQVDKDGGAFGFSVILLRKPIIAVNLVDETNLFAINQFTPTEHSWRRLTPAALTRGQLYWPGGQHPVPGSSTNPLDTKLFPDDGPVSRVRYRMETLSRKVALKVTLSDSGLWSHSSGVAFDAISTYDELLIFSNSHGYTGPSADPYVIYGSFKEWNTFRVDMETIDFDEDEGAIFSNYIIDPVKADLKLQNEFEGIKMVLTLVAAVASGILGATGGEVGKQVAEAIEQIADAVPAIVDHFRDKVKAQEFVPSEIPTFSWDVGFDDFNYGLVTAQGFGVDPTLMDNYGDVPRYSRDVRLPTLGYPESLDHMTVVQDSRPAEREFTYIPPLFEKGGLTVPGYVQLGRPGGSGVTTSSKLIRRELTVYNEPDVRSGASGWVPSGITTLSGQKIGAALSSESRIRAGYCDWDRSVMYQRSVSKPSTVRFPFNLSIPDMHNGLPVRGVRINDVLVALKDINDVWHVQADLWATGGL